VLSSINLYKILKIIPNPMQSLINFSNLTVDYLQEIYDEYVKTDINYNQFIVDLPPDELNRNIIAMSVAISEDYVYKLALFTMEQFHVEKSIRDKCHELNTKLSQHDIEQSMRYDVYSQYKLYYDTVFQTEKKSNMLTFQEIRFIEKMMLNYKYMGMDLPESERSKLEQINKEISDMSSQFSNNISSVNTQFEFIEDELTGMPESWLSSRLVVDVLKEGRKVYKISLKYPDYIPIMERCSNRNTRRLMATAFISRCIDTNTELAQQIINLKHSKAQIMGFENWSDYKLQKQMAKTTSKVMEFLESLKEKIQPLLKSDMEKISALAKLDSIKKIELWDISYYSKKIKEQTADIDMEALKQHFPLNTVMSGMFEIYQQLLGFKFIEITSEAANTLWHSDVKLYKVIDSNTNNLVGHFYLDLFPREGKYSHAAVFPIIRKSSAVLPVCIMACNFDPNSNLRFEEVETFFHEFGHIMHSISAVSEFGSLAGTTCEKDFVEAPSQMLEEWCYVEKALNMMTPVDKPISPETIQKLQTYRKQFVGYHNARQITFGLVDMALHGPDYDKPVAEVYNRIQKEVTGLDPIYGSNFIASFGHIFGGYDAGYYGYLWSEVYAKDMFEKKFSGKELDTEVGHEYKTKVLQWGSIKDSADLLFDFLGGPPTDDAFINSLN
jgi:thimet oligopeptidase